MNQSEIREISGLLATQGSSIVQWAAEHDVSDANVRKAMRGVWKGPGADKVVRELKADIDEIRRRLVRRWKEQGYAA